MDRLAQALAALGVDVRNVENRFDVQDKKIIEQIRRARQEDDRALAALGVDVRNAENGFGVEDKKMIEVLSNLQIFPWPASPPGCHRRGSDAGRIGGGPSHHRSSEARHGGRVHGGGGEDISSIDRSQPL